MGGGRRGKWTHLWEPHQVFSHSFSAWPFFFFFSCVLCVLMEKGQRPGHLGSRGDSSIRDKRCGCLGMGGNIHFFFYCRLYSLGFRRWRGEKTAFANFRHLIVAKDEERRRKYRWPSQRKTLSSSFFRGSIEMAVCIVVKKNKSSSYYLDGKRAVEFPRL